jgi:hypothetical protein
MKPKRNWRDRDWMDTGVTTVIFVIPSGILLAAIAASFTHIKDWALNHAPKDTHEWQGWAFACIVELIPIFGVLVMWKLRKANHGLTVPRFILGAGFLASMAGQVAYAGGLDAGVSRLIVAAGPSFAGLVLTEVLLWLVRTIVEKNTIPLPPPTGVPQPPPMVIPAPPLANVPPAAADPAPPATEEPAPPAPQEREHVSPWSTPPGAPASAPPSAPLPVQGEQGDRQQVMDAVPPQPLPSVDGEGAGEQAPSDSDPLPTQSGEHAPQDTPEEDATPEGSTADGDRGTTGLDPLDLETWEHHQNGKTKKELSTLYGVHEKTIQRRLSKVRAVIESTPKDEEHADA